MKYLKRGSEVEMKIEIIEKRSMSFFFSQARSVFSRNVLVKMRQALLYVAYNCFLRP